MRLQAEPKWGTMLYSCEECLKKDIALEFIGGRTAQGIAQKFKISKKYVEEVLRWYLPKKKKKKINT